jgi:hypothetical protein
MPQIDYDRYDLLKNLDGSLKMMPFVPIPESDGDKYEFWNSYYMRFDKLAQKYYGNAFYDFLILYANPEYISEFDIPDDTLIRIPFPLEDTLAVYNSKLNEIINS